METWLKKMLQLGLAPQCSYITSDIAPPPNNLSCPMAHNPILSPKQRWKDRQGHKVVGFFSPCPQFLSQCRAIKKIEGYSEWCQLHFCSLLPPSLWEAQWHASSPGPLLPNTAENNSQQDLRISLTDKDKEGEQSEKARGLNTFQVSEWKERTNLDSESWALSVRVNGLWQQGSFGSSLLAT